MRIIKHVDNVFAVIAGEMLNIENSTLQYINGEPVVEIDRGYPKIIDGTVVNIIRAAWGYIFVPPGMDRDSFQKELIPVLQRMADSTGKDADSLNRPHTIFNSRHSNIKIKSRQHRTSASYENQPINKRTAMEVFRQFVLNPHERRTFGRFTWIINAISDFDFKICSNNIDDALGRFACSIFYDAENICMLEHNAVTFEFAHDLLKGHSNIINSSVRLFKYGHPLLFELSEFWRESANSNFASTFLRNLVKEKMFNGEYASFKINPVKLTEEGDQTSIEVCTVCRSLLWGENYIVADAIKSPERELCIAICPICLHSNPEKLGALQLKNLHIFRVNFPRTAFDMIASPNIPAERKDILIEALTGITIETVLVSNSAVKFILIGKKYVSFDDINKYLFTGFSNNEIFAGRKVCSVSFIE